MTRIPMGIGLLGNQNLILKRKMRWQFAIQRSCNGTPLNIPPSFVKAASRPNIDIEEVELNYLNAKTYIPGKATWQTMTVTYYDVATTDNLNLWNWLASVINFTDPVNLQQGSRRSDYSATGILTMYDGCGQPIEAWTLLDMFPTNINFGDVEMASNDECNIELTIRYMNVQYQSFCPGWTPQICCTPCGQ